MHETKGDTHLTTARSVQGQYAWPYDGSFETTNSALLIIGMQIDFCARGGRLGVAGTTKIVPAVARVLDGARAAKLPVIFTRESYRGGLSDLAEGKRRLWERRGMQVGALGPNGRFLIRGEPSVDIVADLRIQDSEPLLDQTGFSAFFATDLERTLRERSIRNLIVAGIPTDGAVQATLRDANDRGYECLLLEDCCAAFDDDAHAKALLALKGERAIYGVVSTSDRLLGALG